VIQDYDEAIRLSPRYPRVFYNRGLAWFEKKEYDKAIRDFGEAIRLNPKDELAFSYRGLAWFEKKEYDKAINDYDVAIRLDPKWATVVYLRGNARLGKKEYDKAIEDYDKAIRLVPKYAPAWNNKAYVLAACAEDRLRDVAAAQELMRIAIPLAPTDPYHEETLGVIAAAQGRFEDAIRHQMKAMETRTTPATKRRRRKPRDASDDTNRNSRGVSSEAVLRHGLQLEAHRPAFSMEQAAQRTAGAAGLPPRRSASGEARRPTCAGDAVRAGPEWHAGGSPGRR
jgi:Tfp pilus assembly protein PilF